MDAAELLPGSMSGKALACAGPSLGRQAAEVSHLAAKYALETSCAIGHHALVRSADAGVFLGGAAHELAKQSWPLIADAADGACHLAAEAASHSLMKFKGCLVREEETNSSAGSDAEEERVGELPTSAHRHYDPWLQGPRGVLHVVPVTHVQPAHAAQYVQPSIQGLPRSSSSNLQQQPSFGSSAWPPPAHPRVLRNDGTSQQLGSMLPSPQAPPPQFRRAPSMVVQGGSVSIPSGAGHAQQPFRQASHASAVTPARVLSYDRVTRVTS